MQDLARRQHVIEVAADARDRDRGGQRRPEHRYARALGLRDHFSRRLEPAGDEHAREVTCEEPPQRAGARLGRHAFEEADLALAEDEHASRPQIFVESGQREAGLLDVRQRDLAVEPGRAAEQVRVEAGGGAAGAEQ